MIVVWLLLALSLVAFGTVLLFGAPYLPTRRPQQQTALSLLALRPGQKLYDLGCGDGRLLRSAAKQGIHAVGYELNPILFAIAWLLSLPYPLVNVRWGNFWSADISDADGVFVFLLDHYMPRLDRFMRRQSARKSIRLASYAFQIPGKRAVAQKNAIFLYRYK